MADEMHTLEVRKTAVGRAAMVEWKEVLEKIVEVIEQVKFKD